MSPRVLWELTCPKSHPIKGHTQALMLECALWDNSIEHETEVPPSPKPHLPTRPTSVICLPIARENEEGNGTWHNVSLTSSTCESEEVEEAEDRGWGRRSIHIPLDSKFIWNNPGLEFVPSKNKRKNIPRSFACLSYPPTSTFQCSHWGETESPWPPLIQTVGTHMKQRTGGSPSALPARQQETATRPRGKRTSSLMWAETAGVASRDDRERGVFAAQEGKWTLQLIKQPRRHRS